MSRDAFLTRVRQAAHAGRAYRVCVDQGGSGVCEDFGTLGALGSSATDLCRRMCDEVNEVGGVAHLAEDISAAGEQLLDLLADYNAQTVLMWQHDVIEQLQLKATLQKAGIEVLDHDRLITMHPADVRSAMLTADVGVSSCDIAVAETGSLVLNAQPGQERAASLLPPVHIAVVTRQQIVADLFDAFDQISRYPFDDFPSNLTIITGPSKTGDIELTLTTGVHGPGQWHVIVVG